MAHAQKTFEECDELWRLTGEMAKCQKEANDTKLELMSELIKTIETTFKDQSQIDAVLTTQKYWEEYVEHECRSRMIPGASGSSNATYYHSCRHSKLENRIKELKDYHDCNDNGCPKRIGH
jgi:uncharacterized protein YecT (DUF1311 family)